MQDPPRLSLIHILLELAEGCPDVTVEVVPGLTAALSGGAVLGLSLIHICFFQQSMELADFILELNRLFTEDAPDGLQSVSYTHLDVYKRQGWGWYRWSRCSTAHRPGCAPAQCGALHR